MQVLKALSAASREDSPNTALRMRIQEKPGKRESTSMTARMMKSLYTTLTVVSVQDSFIISWGRQKECVTVCVWQYDNCFRMKGRGKKNTNPLVRAASQILVTVVTVGPVSTEACRSGWQMVTTWSNAMASRTADSWLTEHG